MNTNDILVIGGGPAGCAAAILLSQAGRNIFLIEKENAPHDKVCGEFISWEAEGYLRALGIDPPALGAQRILRARIIDKDRILELDLPSPGWSLSRRVLDEALLKSAIQSGVIIRRGARATEIIPCNGNWKAQVKQEWFDAKTIFLASGKHDIRGCKRQGRRNDLIGFKIHLQLTAPQQKNLHEQVEIFLFNGGYAGLEPVEDGKANLCFLLSKKSYADCRNNGNNILAWLGERSGHLKARLENAAPLWPCPVSVSAVPYGFLHKPKDTAPGLYRLGDQMAVIPSFAGDGISMALHSGFLAAQTYLSGADAETYHRRARSDFLIPMRNAKLIAALLSTKQGRTCAFMVLRLQPGLMLPTVQGLRLKEDKILRKTPDVLRGR